MSIKLHHDLNTATATQLDLKADSEGRISGYGSIFGNTDRHGEVVQRGAFAKSLADLKQRGEMPSGNSGPNGFWSASKPMR